MKFGVREICDVVFKAKKSGSLGSYKYNVGQPVLYIDTAKASTIEGAASTVYATGGRGNARLIAWEGEKTLTFTVEDALLSEKGLAILTGAGLFNPLKVYQHTINNIANWSLVFEDGEGVDQEFIVAQESLSILAKNSNRYSTLYDLLTSNSIIYNSNATTIYKKDCLVLKVKESKEAETEKDLWLIAPNIGEYCTAYLQNGSEISVERQFSIDSSYKNDGNTLINIPFEDYTITLNNPIKVHQTEKTIMTVTISSNVLTPEILKVSNAEITLSQNNGPISTNAPIFVMQVDENGHFVRAFSGLEVLSSREMESLSLAVIGPNSSIDTLIKELGVGTHEIPIFVDYYTEEKPAVTQFIIDAENFADYYYVEATTDFRRQSDGKDLKAMITFPNVKVQSNFTFNMAATGDPSTFSFVMDAMPGYTINRPNKKVLCEMEIVNANEIKNTYFINHIFDDSTLNKIDTSKFYSVMDTFKILPMETINSNEEFVYAGDISLTKINDIEGANTSGTMRLFIHYEVEPTGSTTPEGALLYIQRPIEVKVLVYPLGGPMSLTLEDSSNTAKTVVFNQDNGNLTFNIEQVLLEYLILTPSDDSLKPQWKITADSTIKFKTGINNIVT